MDAGELRDRIAFELRVEQTDDYGNAEGDFVEQFVVAAKVKARLGGEDVMAARLAGRQPVTITVRQTADTRRITTAWRARDARNGQLYNIRSLVDPEAGKRAWLDVLCDTGGVAT